MKIDKELTSMVIFFAGLISFVVSFFWLVWFLSYGYEIGSTRYSEIITLTKEHPELLIKPMKDNKITKGEYEHILSEIEVMETNKIKSSIIKAEQ